MEQSWSPATKSTSGGSSPSSSQCTCRVHGLGRLQSELVNDGQASAVFRTLATRDMAAAKHRAAKHRAAQQRQQHLGGCLAAEQVHCATAAKPGGTRPMPNPAMRSLHGVKMSGSTHTAAGCRNASALVTAARARGGQARRGGRPATWGGGRHRGQCEQRTAPRAHPLPAWGSDLGGIRASASAPSRLRPPGSDIRWPKALGSDLHRPRL